MKERGRFIYKSPDGTICVSFEKGTPGVPIESLLPESGRGAGCAAFRVVEYLNLADAVLATPNEWDAFCKRANQIDIEPAQTAQLASPSINLDFLQLRRADGSTDPAKAANLFSVVAAYWKNDGTLALQPGLVASLWRRGLSCADILRYIRACTDQDGQFVAPTGRGAEIMAVVYDVFLNRQAVTEPGVLSQNQVKDMIDIWLQATRSVPLTSPEARNEALHWSDYRRLGMVDTAGHALIDNVRRLAKRVFSSDPAPSFADLVAWVDQQNPAKPTGQSKTAQAQLKKKRKQGRLNRKRGRR